MPTEADLIREACDYIGELIRPRGRESALHMWSRGVELEAKLRAALPEPPRDELLDDIADGDAAHDCGEDTCVCEVR